MSDKALLEAFQGFDNCTRAAEQSAIDRLLTVSGSTKKAAAAAGRADVEFALALVNQCNQLFSKRGSELRCRKQTEETSDGRPSVVQLEEESVGRILRVVVAAFKFLHSNRSAAGFSALALEKTMSNFSTACVNAHLGVRAWNSLVFLRQCLLDHAETHTVVVAAANGTRAATALASGRAVRKPATKLAKGAKAPTTAAPKNQTAASSTSERLSAGMRRLSIVRDASLDGIPLYLSSMAHFPISFNRGDTAFNVLVVTLLCNVLRILSQAPSAPQTTELMSRLGVRSHSALEWCLRLQDVDSAAAEPFLGACFRAYYALGSVSSSPGALDIRVLGLAAYASTKACDVRELLRYAVRAASRAESLATADDLAAHRPIAAYYVAVAELAKPLLANNAGTATPEMVDFYHRWSMARRGTGDLAGALEVCSQVAARSGGSGGSEGDSHAELVACALACNCVVQHMLTCGEQHSDAMPAGKRMAVLAEAALGRSARHTLAGWNALAMCADISRKTGKRAVAELREPRLGAAARDCVAGAMVCVLDAADRIYEAYISRGAALKAQEAGGGSSSVAALRSCNAEVCVLAVQLAVQYGEHDSAAARHSDRLLQLCREPGCGPADVLRSHSTVFFNRGASLYQLKSYGPAARAMERAIDSLALWVALTADASADVFAQLCKRYEIAALAHQADGAYARASQVLGRAVAWIAGRAAVLGAVAAGSAVLPVDSSRAASCGEVARLLVFVDRYVRMCAARLARDASEPQARASLLDHVAAAAPIASAVLRAWVYEAEAWHWRPFAAAPAASYALDVRAARLQCAQALYASEGSALGGARCLVELAKIDRDRGNAGQCTRRLHEAAAAAAAAASEPACVYALGVAAECHAWLAMVAIERDDPPPAYAEHLAQSTQLWARISSQAADSQPDAGHLLGAVVDAMSRTAELLLSRRMYSAALGVLRPKLDIASACEEEEAHARASCAPVAMLALVDLGTASLLLGQTTAAAEHFRQAAERYEDGVLPVHVEVASKIAYASFRLACGDEAEGARIMRSAGVLARSVLGAAAASAGRSARSKRPVVSPETMLLFSRASQAYSVLSLRQGALADAVDFGLHSYRILHSLLRSLGAAHARAKQEALESLGRSSNANDDDDDPFAMEAIAETKAPAQAAAVDEDDDDDYCQLIAFGGNWELQRLVIDNLAHLSEIYSVRGSVKEAEYFLRKGLSISARLHAPRQEGFLRLREADILARKRMWHECAESLAKVRPLSLQQQIPPGSGDHDAELETIRALVVEGDAWRRGSKHEEAAGAYRRAQAMLSRGAVDDVLRQVVAEDLDIRLRLLAVLAQDAGNGDGELLLAGSGDELLLAAGGDVVRRCIDQRPEHLLMQANVAFAELQRMLSSEPAWSPVLQSALVFPALRRRHPPPKQQQLRKGSAKAMVRDCLAALDALLVAAAESAITIGSSHCVHESCHLLALTRAMSTVFGLSPSADDMVGHSSRTLANIIDDARNITAVREAVDVIRRKRRNAVPASLTRWPSDALESGDNQRDGVVSNSLSSSPSLLPHRRHARRQSSSESSPSKQLPRPLLFDPRARDDSEEDSSAAPAVDYFGYAVDGAKVVAGWGAPMAVAAAAVKEDHHRQLLPDCLPADWVVCSISIDSLRNVLFITRYERHCDPLVVCLPMREIEGESEKEEELTGTHGLVGEDGVFGDLQRKLAAVIAKSDQSMKTGASCTTEDEKRKWWELRSELDRQLGHLLQCVETEWLGGFKDVVLPDSPLLLALNEYVSSAEVLVDVDLLRRDIQTCIAGCLTRAFAAKARAMELSDQL
ncbi:separin protein, partial [Coemansia sp. RSA 2424]